MFSIGLEKRALSRLTNFAVLLKHDYQGDITLHWDFLKKTNQGRVVSGSGENSTFVSANRRR